MNERDQWLFCVYTVCTCIKSGCEGGSEKGTNVAITERNAGFYYLSFSGIFNSVIADRVAIRT